MLSLGFMSLVFSSSYSHECQGRLECTIAPEDQPPLLLIACTSWTLSLTISANLRLCLSLLSLRRLSLGFSKCCLILASFLTLFLTKIAIIRLYALCTDPASPITTLRLEYAVPGNAPLDENLAEDFSQISSGVPPYLLTVMPCRCAVTPRHNSVVDRLSEVAGQPVCSRSS